MVIDLPVLEHPFRLLILKITVCKLWGTSIIASGEMNIISASDGSRADTPISSFEVAPWSQPGRSPHAMLEPRHCQYRGGAMPLLRAMLEVSNQKLVLSGCCGGFQVLRGRHTLVFLPPQILRHQSAGPGRHRQRLSYLCAGVCLSLGQCIRPLATMPKFPPHFQVVWPSYNLPGPGTTRKGSGG